MEKINKYILRFCEVYLLFYFIVFTGYRYQIAKPEILAVQTFILSIIMVVWLIYLLVNKESPGLPVNPGMYLIYGGFYLSSLFGSTNINYSLPEGYLFFVASFLFVGILSLIRYGWSRRDLLDSLLWVGLIYTVMKGVQVFTGIEMIRFCSRQNIIVANKSGGFLALVAVVSLSIWLNRKERKEWLGLLTFIGSTVTLLLVASRGAFVGAIAGIVIVLLIHVIVVGRYKWKQVVLIGSALILLPIISTAIVRPTTCLAEVDGEIISRESSAWNSNISNRNRLQATAFHVFMDYPLKGSGPGTFPLFTGPDFDYNKYIPHSHSIYMNVLAERGLIGFIMSAIVIISMLHTLLFLETDPLYAMVGVGALFVLLFQGIFDVVINEPFVMRYLFAIVAVAVGPKLDNGE